MSEAEFIKFGAWNQKRQDDNEYAKSNGYASGLLYGKPHLAWITPDIVRMLFSIYRFTGGYRTFKLEQVVQFSKLMKEGKWVETKEHPVMIDKHGVILNGRHRLHTVLLSGCSVWLPVLSEIDLGNIYLREFD